MQHVLGQRHAIDTLRSSLRTGRLHHAYIFHGPAGVGKFTTARAFARALLCHRRPTNPAEHVEPCGQCESCKRFHDTAPETDTPGDHTAHPDFHVINKELARFSDDSSVRSRKLTSIPVEVIRQSLLDPVYRAAQLSHGKVFVVDEAELLNPTGQNLLLKTLEEPPHDTYLILVTSSEDRLLPTIRSRCHRLAFTPLPDDAVSQWLDTQAPKLSSPKRAWLLRFADGSLGRAQLALRYDLSQWAQTVESALRQLPNEYPHELGQQMAQMIDDFAKQWVDSHENASKEAANRQGSGLMWSLIGEYARQQLTTLAKRCDPEDPQADPSLMDPWLGVLDSLETTLGELHSNVNIGLVTEHLVSLIYRSLAGDRFADTVALR